MASSFLSVNQPVLNQAETVNRFKGQVVIITGGASGIGRSTAERFLNDGAKVVVFDINETAGKDVEEYARQRSRDLSFYRVDVSDKTECERGVAEVVKKYGDKINHLVNSVAYFGSKGLNSKVSDWEKTFSVNVIGYVNMVQACHPFLTNANGSSIVNVCSISAHRAQPVRWTYAGSKGAVLIMTKCMALDLAVDKIRVNSVSPAWIWTPEVSKAIGWDPKEYGPTMESYHMLRRLGETSEVAAGIAFLCSKDASFITGVDLPVDGGYTAMGPEQHGEASFFAGANI